MVLEEGEEEVESGIVIDGTVCWVMWVRIKVSNIICLAAFMSSECEKWTFGCSIVFWNDGHMNGQNMSVVTI
jgi:hypothetical protein